MLPQMISIGEHSELLYLGNDDDAKEHLVARKRSEMNLCLYCKRRERRRERERERGERERERVT